MTQLTPVVLMNAETSAGTYPSTGPYNIDYRFDNDKLRSVSGVRSDTNDAIYVLLETVVPLFGQNGVQTGTVIVTATATVWTSANSAQNSCVIQGPFTRIKLQKVGASGAATFVGLL